MKYIVSGLILLVNLYNYQSPINSLLFLFIHVILFFIIFFLEKNKSSYFKFIELLIISWPISWINIFGGATEQLQLPWYYIFGLFLALNLVIKRKDKIKLYGKKFTILNYILLLFYSIVPLIICQNFVNGLADYMMILFFIIVLFAAHVSNITLTTEEIHELRKMFIYINLISAIGIIFQYVMFRYFGQMFFKLGRTGSFDGGNQTACLLLLEDASCSTIMLGCGVLYAFIMGDKGKKIYYILALIILIGLALTSRRTSVLSLLIIFVLYFFKEKKGAYNRIISIVLLPLIMLVTLYFLTLSRPVDNLSQYLNDTGRFADYISGIEVALKNPLGVGYGDTYLASLMNNKIIPHNTVLRLLDMGGILLTVPLIIIFMTILFDSKKKKLKIEYWNLLYVFLASNFIPDILNSRFLLIICLLVLLSNEQILNVISNKKIRRDVYG